MKCPCEDCLLIPICNNRHSCKPVNFVMAMEKCSLLYNFFEVIETCVPTMEFWSNLDSEELTEKLEEAGKFLPYE